MLRKRHYEILPSNTSARMYGRAGSVSSFQRRRRADSFRSAFHACPPQTRIQKEVSCESASARTKAKGRYFGLGPRFPRHGLVNGFRLSHLAGEFCIGKPSVHNVSNADLEPLCIG